MSSPIPAPARVLGLLVAAAAALPGCTTFQNFYGGVAGAAPSASAPAGATGPGGTASGLRPPGAPPLVAAAGDAPPVRRRRQGREAQRRRVRFLAEGRQGLARAQAGRLQQAVLPLAQAQDRDRRAQLLRRADGRRRHRRVPPHPQPGAADLAATSATPPRRGRRKRGRSRRGIRRACLRARRF